MYVSLKTFSHYPLYVDTNSSLHTPPSIPTPHAHTSSPRSYPFPSTQMVSTLRLFSHTTLPSFSRAALAAAAPPSHAYMATTMRFAHTEAPPPSGAVQWAAYVPYGDNKSSFEVTTLRRAAPHRPRNAASTTSAAASASSAQPATATPRRQFSSRPPAAVTQSGAERLGDDKLARGSAESGASPLSPTQAPYSRLHYANKCAADASGATEPTDAPPSGAKYKTHNNPPANHSGQFHNEGGYLV